MFVSADNVPQRLYPGDFQGEWLWGDQLAPNVYCKAVWKNPQHPAKKSYSMKVLADNQFTLYCNGERIASSEAWQEGWTGSIELADGDVLTVEALDQDGGRLAGLVLAVVDQGETILSSADLRLYDRLGRRISTPGDAQADLAGLAAAYRPVRASDPSRRRGEHGQQAARSGRFLDQTIPAISPPKGPNCGCMHRRIDSRDLYAVFHPGSTDAAVAVIVPRRRRARTLGRRDGPSPVDRPLRTSRRQNGDRNRIGRRRIELVVFSEKPTAITARRRRAVIPAGDVASEVLSLEGTWDFCVEPVLDNRFGDFHNPATPELLGVEARRMRCFEQFDPSVDTANFTKPEMDDSAWPEVTAGFGPRFWLLGPIPPGTDTAALEQELSAMRSVDPERPIRVGGVELRWTRFDYSLRFGMENDPMLQQQSAYAIHGPIGCVPDEFIHLQGAPGSTWYLWTSASAARPGTSRLAVGTRAAYRVWWNGRSILEDDRSEGYLRDGGFGLRDYPTPIRTAPIELAAEAEPLLVRLTADGRDGQARAFVQFDADLTDREPLPRTAGPTGNADFTPEGLVASRWFTDPPDAAYDPYAGRRPAALWYRFVTPPGVEVVRVGRPRSAGDLGRRKAPQRSNRSRTLRRRPCAGKGRGDGAWRCPNRWKIPRRP